MGITIKAAVVMLPAIVLNLSVALYQTPAVAETLRERARFSLHQSKISAGSVEKSNKAKAEGTHIVGGDMGYGARKGASRASRAGAQCWQGYCNSATSQPDARLIMTMTGGKDCPNGMLPDKATAEQAYFNKHTECSPGNAARRTDKIASHTFGRPDPEHYRQRGIRSR